jgi:hypothetical protein
MQLEQMQHKTEIGTQEATLASAKCLEDTCTMPQKIALSKDGGTNLDPAAKRAGAESQTAMMQGHGAGCSCPACTGITKLQA